jgi:hypothetical protein
VSARACGTCLLCGSPGPDGWALCLALDNDGKLRGRPVLPSFGESCRYWRESNVRPEPRALPGDEEGR